MINLKDIEIKLVTLNSEDFNVDEFHTRIYQSEVCIAFINFDHFMLDNLFINAGFTKMDSAENFHYLKIMGSFIFIINIELNLSNFVIRERYTLMNSEKNLWAVKSFTHMTFNDGSFKDFHSDSDVFCYSLYPESLDIPFHVDYLVRSAYAQPKLLRADLAFKYGNDKFMIASLFDINDKHIQIAYDTYKKNCNYIYADFIEFRDETLISLEIVNPRNQKKMSMLDIDEFNPHSITLDNYHLFWEHYTHEQLTLIEMLMV